MKPVHPIVAALLMWMALVAGITIGAHYGKSSGRDEAYREAVKAQSALWGADGEGNPVILWYGLGKK